MITRSSYMYMYTFLDMNFFFRYEVLQQLKLKFMKILNFIKKTKPIAYLKSSTYLLVVFFKNFNVFQLVFQKTKP
jgi:hypothetical protein